MGIDSQFTTIGSDTRSALSHAIVLVPQTQICIHYINTGATLPRAWQAWPELLCKFAANSHARLYMCKNIEKFVWLLTSQRNMCLAKGTFITDHALKDKSTFNNNHLFQVMALCHCYYPRNINLSSLIRFSPTPAEWKFMYLVFSKIRPGFVWMHGKSAHFFTQKFDSTPLQYATPTLTPGLHSIE